MPERGAQQKPVGDMTGRLFHQQFLKQKAATEKQLEKRRREIEAEQEEIASIPPIPMAETTIYDDEQIIDYTTRGGYRGTPTL